MAGRMRSFGYLNKEMFKKYLTDSKASSNLFVLYLQVILS
jgi:hypothetical protein